MAIRIDPEKSSLLRAAPRLMQILRVLTRQKFLGALRGKGHWPPPKEVRETFEELGLTFLKFGQVLAIRRDLLLDARLGGCFMFSANQWFSPGFSARSLFVSVPDVATEAGLTLPGCMQPPKKENQLAML
jgi:hypothetical protein